MVSILLVSHSARLAEGVRELAQQMAPGVAILAAGGTDEGELGTSFERILTGLTQATETGAVLVLMDLGSAVLTTEAALDFLPDEARVRVRLSPAPLVEGALAAATVAAGGAPLDTVAAAAAEAGAMQKLADAPATSAPPVPAEGPARHVEIVNPAGLHARPAAQLVQALAPFDAEVTLRNETNGRGATSARSLVGLLGLGAQRGHRLEARASGPDAQAALDVLAQRVASGFGEMEGPALPALPATPPVALPAADLSEGLRGVPAAPGLAIGPAFWLEEGEPAIPETPAADPAAEVERLEAALTQARQALATLERVSAAQAGQAEAAIFAAQRLLLDDPALHQSTRARIAAQGENGAAAWWAVVQEQAEALRVLPDPLIAGRAADLLDVGRRVLRLLGGEEGAPHVPPGTVVLARDVTPSEMVALQQAQPAGLATEGGGATSHAAILARALGVPAVVGVGPALRQLGSGTLLVLDGAQGTLYPEPDEAALARYQAEAAAEAARRAAAQAVAQAPAQTSDGRRVEVAANVASVAEAQAALANGAEGIGLLRTEFLYLNRPDVPSEDEQVAALRAIFEPMGARPIIVRTLDVGGDKSLPALSLDPVTHSFLGVRGLRYSLQHPALFQTQLRAILRAAAGHQVRVMFPMVTLAEEVRQARTHLAAAEAALAAASVPCGTLAGVGIMVEVPAAALAAAELAAEVDFFSVGSNDLVQYTMAAERTNRAVSALYRPDHPALLRLLAGLVEQAHAAGRWVGVCGEMAGDPALAPLLVGLGVDELSVAPAAVPGVKAAIRQVSAQAAQAAVAATLRGEGYPG